MVEILAYEVRCKSTAPYYELIAAFNCEQAAKAYAEECQRVNRRFTYRVLKGGKVLEPVPYVPYRAWKEG